MRRKQAKNGAAGVAAVQTARGGPSFSELDRYAPLRTSELRFYDAIRAAVPVVDAAIGKIVRLTGGFRVECGDDPALSEELARFLQTVRVGPASHGIGAFVAAYLEQLLLYGTAVGEMVLSAQGDELAALYNAPLDAVELKRGENPLEYTICSKNGRRGAIPAPYPELILLSALNPAPGQVTGTSLLRGLPFVSDVLLKIYESIGNNFERLGNLRFAVTYRPSPDGADRANARERAMQIAQEWSSAMQNGQVKDFIAVGDVDIRVIGADNQMIEVTGPARLMLEQIVAKTGIPPFMLGLNWSSTERMSKQQADTLTSELEYYRTVLTPVILRICGFWARLHGHNEPLRVEWEAINLQDEVELARARLLSAQARQIETALADTPAKDFKINDETKKG